MTPKSEYIDVGTRIVGLSETSDGDLQIDMENHETLILSAEDVDDWRVFRGQLDELPTAERLEDDER